MTDDVIGRLQAAWSISDRLFASVKPEAMTLRPIRLRHPFIFYLGHLPAFSWNQLGGGLLGKGPVRAEFEDLFARGIDPKDDADPTAGDREAWPDMGTVEAYRDEVRGRLLAAAPEVEARAADSVMAQNGRIWHVLLEHELMHHETLLYMLACLDPAQLLGPPSVPADSGSRRGAPTNPTNPDADVGDFGDAPPMVEIPGGDVTLGRAFEGSGFGWDNEFPERAAHVADFSISRLPVTNAEMLAFVEAGGYADRRWWSDAGWDMLRHYELRQPWSWSQDRNGWRVRTVFGHARWEQNAAARWPASVSWVEAEAYACWKGCRLPTEPEWLRAVFGTPDGPERRYPWGDDDPTPRHARFGNEGWAPSPVDAHPDGASAFGLLDAVGNGWEWTTTVFAEHPGFTPYMPHYPGYSADFFDGAHRVMLGGSWATARPLLRRSFRNWFQPHYPFVFSAFRLADAPGGGNASTAG